ncbi:MAG: UDP-N-acetylmuramoyl-L-alanyl-D-glutamate--2,6-diaminopimelate ligase [Syntrophomonadaceae bacterium]|nr:UDP-N-acetylmuramoyl-L-alanyl-D-glutamate--2,6-diaminopimelate ligase [Syntrophomonadaceae bacterium]
MRLDVLLENIEYSCTGSIDNCDIKGIAYDSRKVKNGYLFVCVKGFQNDGHDFAVQAVENGAVAVLSEKVLPLQPAGFVSVVTGDTRKALSVLAANFYGKPSERIKVAGVTGTNGKTTVTHMIKAVLEEAGNKTGVVGTLYSRIGDEENDLGLTTPEALELERFLAECERQNAWYVTMEISAHAAALHRIDNVNFYCAVFTNLSQDHLDFFSTMEEYLDAKLGFIKMLSDENGGFCVINGDDGYRDRFINASGVPCYTYGFSEEATVRADKLTMDKDGAEFMVEIERKRFPVKMKLIGRFNVYNALAAITFAWRAGIDFKIIQKALANFREVAGRFEKIDRGQDFTLVVDYAHTPDGLENILKTAKEIAPGRIITVFGCGGNRDKGKRPLMGEIAAKFSDFTIITSDNPRDEEAIDIVNEIVPGVNKVENSRYAIILDRREAIHHAVNLAKKNDFVIIAGKGHENYQIIKGKKSDFDDRKVAAEFLEGLM